MNLVELARSSRHELHQTPHSARVFSRTRDEIVTVSLKVLRCSELRITLGSCCKGSLVCQARRSRELCAVLSFEQRQCVCLGSEFRSQVRDFRSVIR